MDIDSSLATNLTILVPQMYLGDDYLLPANPALQMIPQTVPGVAMAVTYVGLQPLTIYETVIRSLQFSNTEEEPFPGPRYVRLYVLTRGADEQFITSNRVQSTITLLPRNDQPPVFSQAVYYGSVSENKPSGTSVGVVVSATDPDTYSQTTITYSIVGENNYFSVHPDSGVVLTSTSLDAEHLPAVLNLTVMAEDSDGNHVQSSFVTVSISIRDVNDNAPVFNQTFYLVSVLENTVANSVILTASASDLDQTSVNSQVVYTLQEHNNILTPNPGSGLSSGDMLSSLPFQVNYTTGVVQVTGSLDYEQESQYTFFIVARDTGSPSLSSSTELTITIEDINDNRPVFLGTPYRANVAELAIIGTPVLTVHAVDADSGANGNIIFYLENTSTFSVNQSSGRIYLSSNVDYESQASHTFTVTAQDQGTPSLRFVTTVQIMVLNQNDHPPVFARNNYTIVVRESERFTNMQIEATDDDGDALTYLIVSQCIDAFFINSSTGLLSQTKLLDREVIPVCTVSVSAFDGLHTSDIEVYVIVEDINDNSPSFNQTSYSVTIPEIMPVGSMVVVVVATDRDAGINAEITYTIEPASTFNINFLTGAITIATPLNYEFVQSYNLTATARDNGNPQRLSSIPVFIYITDSNDNTPALFIANPLTTYKEESGQVPIVKGLRIVDPDSSPLTMATITFNLPSCPSNDNFNVVCANNPVCMELCEEGLILNTTLLNNLSVNYIANDLKFIINITGSGSTSVYQQLLSSLTYINTLDEPTSGVRTVDLVVQDGTSMSDILQLNISVLLVDDHCPLVHTQSTSIIYRENTGSLFVGQLDSISITDADLPPHQHLSQLQVRLSGHFDGENEVIAVNSSILPSSISISTLANRITLSGDAPISLYQQFLHTLTYTNNQNEPTPGARKIEITPVQSGLNCTSVQLSVVVELTNDNAPQLMFQNLSTLPYEEEVGELFFAQAAGLSITDADNSDLIFANVTLEGASDAETIQLTGSLPPGITAEQTSNTVRLSGAASSHVYESVLKSVGYMNTATEPTQGNRTITIAVSDGVHNVHSSVIIIIVLRNDNPLQLFSNILRLNFTEGSVILNIGEKSGLALSDDDQNSLVHNLTISLTSREPGKEFIGAQVNGALVNSSSTISFDQPASLTVYQVRKFAYYSDVLCPCID